LKYLRSKEKRDVNNANIDMSGMMDIIFILLIFLMVFLSFNKMNQSIPIDLPQSGTGAANKKETVIIAVKKNGEIFLNEKPLDLPHIENLAKKGEFANKELLLNIDKKAEYENFIRIFSIVQSSNVGSIRLGVKN
jgi:biopolymer transport protein ExbD